MNKYGSNDAKTYWDRLLWLEEQGDEDMVDETTLLLVTLFEMNKETRSIKWINSRINWKDHIRRELHTKTFESKYHMPLPAFNKLLGLVREGITLDYVKSMNASRGNQPIYPEVILGISLRYLGGEKIKSLEDIFGVDDSSVERLIKLFFKTVHETKALAIKLPNTQAQLEELAQGFDSISAADGLFYGCVGAIDGWLCQTIQPIDNNIKNKRDYFSGHYQCFGLNIQAICDHRLRFIYFGITSPGKTGDARALNKCIKLRQWMEKHLKNSPFFFVGDNAYVLCDELLIPYSGNNMTESQRTYNFYLSQMRIRIEMAFGRLTTKWRVFRTKLENTTETNSKICSVAAILHNYIINETDIDERADGFISPLPGAPSDNLGYLPAQGDDEEETGGVSGEGYSHRRMAFLSIVQRDGMVRPLHNVVRNNRNNN